MTLFQPRHRVEEGAGGGFLRTRLQLFLLGMGGLGRIRGWVASARPRGAVADCIAREDQLPSFLSLRGAGSMEAHLRLVPRVPLRAPDQD